MIRSPRRALLVGSANPHKLAEIRSLLEDLPVEVLGSDALPPATEVEESGETFLENARIKAIAWARRAATLGASVPAQASAPGPSWVIADDSGLAVDALEGAPGVRSARYAGPGADSEKNNRKLLEELRDVPAEERSARFVCVIACAEVPARAAEEPRILFEVEGRAEGSIAGSPRGEGGFGYDPLFIEKTTGSTFAELTAREKNRVSHRGRALERFRERFREALSDGG